MYPDIGFQFVFTPKYGSWLNIAEIELHVFNGQSLNRHIANMNKVKSEDEVWQNCRNNQECQNKLAVHQRKCMG